MNQLTGKGVQVALVASLATGTILGLSVGWKLWRPKALIVEQAHPAARQSDGSLELAVSPNANQKPAQEVPRGAVVERVVYVTVKPNPSNPGPSGTALPPIPGSNVTALPPMPSLPPSLGIRVDLTLLRMPDGSHRVTASSPDGTITGGMDIPAEAAQPAPKVLKYAGGVVYGQSVYGDKSVGMFIDRDFAFVRAGVEVTKTTYTTIQKIGWDGRVKIGIRF